MEDDGSLVAGWQTVLNKMEETAWMLSAHVDPTREKSLEYK
jgi:hypothetical protein